MFFNSLRLAVRSTLANKMRSFLTMLGIIIGVMSVIVLVSIAQSTTSSITSAIASMGSDLLTVTVTDEDVTLGVDDFMEIEQYDAIAGVAPYLTVSSTARSGSNYTSVSAIGITGDYMEIAGRDMESGRSIVDSDLDWRTYTAVIGTEVAGELFESYDVLGKTFTMSGHTFTIVGLLSETGSDTDSQILIPLTTAQRFADSTAITTAYVKASSTNTVDIAQAQTEYQMLLLTRDEDSYDVYNMSELLETMDDVMNTLSLMLGGIAAISLLVGGIGIMNIMLVSVAERTREIGIRKAIGARRSHIMMQFLIEACVLSILGGLIGLGLSALGLKIFAIIADMTIAMEWRAAIIALLFCVVIGVAFGSYPAAKASKMTPIEALQRN
ncbi:MAG: FtsX-like permease family protein [Alphaproteobacteria bacterium]|nr:FtsX-like permease family protein [Alphaproteobacteria bacterium]